MLCLVVATLIHAHTHSMSAAEKKTGNSKSAKRRRSNTTVQEFKQKWADPKREEQLRKAVAAKKAYDDEVEAGILHRTQTIAEEAAKARRLAQHTEKLEDAILAFRDYAQRHRRLFRRVIGNLQNTLEHAGSLFRYCQGLNYEDPEYDSDVDGGPKPFTISRQDEGEGHPANFQLPEDDEKDG